MERRELNKMFLAKIVTDKFPLKINSKRFSILVKPVSLVELSKL